ILAILMFVSGVLLVTGATISGLVAGAHRAARGAGRGTRELARTVRAQGLGLSDPAEPGDDEVAVTRLGETEPLATESLRADESNEFDELSEPGWEEEPDARPAALVDEDETSAE